MALTFFCSCPENGSVVQREKLCRVTVLVTENRKLSVPLARLTRPKYPETDYSIRNPALDASRLLLAKSF